VKGRLLIVPLWIVDLGFVLGEEGEDGLFIVHCEFKTRLLVHCPL